MKLALFFFLLPVHAFGQNPRLRLAEVKGEVVLRPAGAEQEWVLAQEGAPLENGDRIRTGPGASASIVSPEGTVFELRENTEVSAYGTPLDIEMGLPLGTLLSRVQPKARKVSVRTPTAIVAVRGTEFAVVHEEEATQTGVYEGEVALRRLDEMGGPIGEWVRLKREEAARIVREEIRKARLLVMAELARHRAREAELRRMAEEWKTRWQEMTEQQRRETREQMTRRWQEMPPEQKQEIRDRLIEKWRNLPPEQRDRLQQWYDRHHGQRSEAIREFWEVYRDAERLQQMKREAEELKRQGKDKDAKEMEKQMDKHVEFQQDWLKRRAEAARRQGQQEDARQIEEAERRYRQMYQEWKRHWRESQQRMKEMEEQQRKYQKHFEKAPKPPEQGMSPPPPSPRPAKPPEPPPQPKPPSPPLQPPPMPKLP